MVAHTDFTKAFQTGFQLQYRDSFDEPYDVTFSTRTIGELVLTSGKLVACDPLSKPEKKGYCCVNLMPGSYPVTLSIADFEPRNTDDLSNEDLEFMRYKKIACAMLVIGDRSPVEWEITLRPGQNLRSLKKNQIFGYGVYSGIGSFMDEDAAQVLRNLIDDFKYHTKLCDELQRNAVNDGVDWASIHPGDRTPANIIAFSSGQGDGFYASYWGYDSRGDIACLVTDFLILDQKEILAA
jgi:hypothetical protein